MKHLNYIIGLGLAVVCLYSCKTKILQPLDEGHGAPGPVTNVEIENRPGAAKISYTLPDDVDLLYVRAEYNTGDIKREVKASFYNDTLIVNGFGQAGAYDINLYAVNNAEQASEPVTVTVHPTEPPVRLIYNSLETSSTFGGISIHYENIAEAEVSIHVVTPDSTGEMSTADILYTKSDEGIFNVRGYKPMQRQFGIYVKDHFGNLSDTLFAELTPIEEVRLDPELFMPVHLQGDYPICCGWLIEHLWDDVISGSSGYASAVDQFPGGANEQPGHVFMGDYRFTMDLGVKAKLSRYIVWPRLADNNYYNVACPKNWEIWGSNNPDPNGSYEGWEKIMSCTMTKPSGLPVGNNSTEDIAAANAGFEFTFPADAPAVRYIRFRLVGLNWGGTYDTQLTEWRFWGRVIE